MILLNKNQEEVRMNFTSAYALAYQHLMDHYNPDDHTCSPDRCIKKRFGMKCPECDPDDGYKIEDLKEYRGEEQ